MSMSTAEIKNAPHYKPTLRDLLAIFFFYKRTFLLTFIGVVAGALLLALLSPSIYKATASVVVKPRLDKPAIFQADTSNLANNERVEQTTMNTVVYLMNSSDVLRSVILKLNLAPADDEAAILEQVNRMRGRVLVEPVSMSNLIEVNMKGSSPADARDTLNVLLDAYIEYHIKVNQSLSGQLEFFDRQAKVFRSKYEQLGQELADMHRRLNMVNPDIQGENQLKEVSEMESMRLKVLGRLGRLQQQRAYLQETYNKPRLEEALAGLPVEVAEAYPALMQMEKSLAQLVINLQRAQSDFLPGTKPTADAEAQYSNMRKQIRAYIASAIENLGVDLESAQLELKQLSEKIRQGKDGLGDLSADALLLGQLDFEYRMAEDTYKLYETKREDARINKEKDRANFANVSIASRPLLPINAWFPQRGLIMIIAVVLGFLLAIAATLAVYFLDYTVRTPTDILLRSRFRFLGTLDAI